MHTSFKLLAISIFIASIISCKKSEESTNTEITVKTDTIQKSDTISTDTKATVFQKETTNEETAAKIKGFLTDYLKTDLKLLESNDRKFSFYEIDLNDDGKNEHFVQLYGPYFCGSGGCTFLLLDNNMKIVNRFTVTDAPIYRSKTKTNGWHDLIVLSRNDSENPEYIHLKFDGRKYPSNPTIIDPEATSPDDGDFIMWKNQSNAKEFPF